MFEKPVLVADKLDSRHLAEKLQRYVLVNHRAMVPVYVPSETEEQQRIEARHRRKLSQQIRSLEVRGQGLLLSEGVFRTSNWWREVIWQKFKPQLCPQLLAALALIMGFGFANYTTAQKFGPGA